MRGGLDAMAKSRRSRLVGLRSRLNLLVACMYTLENGGGGGCLTRQDMSSGSFCEGWMPEKEEKAVRRLERSVEV